MNCKFIHFFNQKMTDMNAASGSKNLFTAGVVAHSIRALELDQLADLIAYAKAHNLVFHMHVEEQTLEIEQCKQGRNDKTPLQCILECAKKTKVDDQDLSFMTLVHCTQSTAQDIAEYHGKRKGNVCICPLTEGSLADGIPQWEVAKYKDRIVVGTDSNLRIDFLEELRW